jgi:hypothetical protein
VEHIQLINDNNGQLWCKLFMGIGSILSDAPESIFLNPITSAASQLFLFVILMNYGNLQVEFHAMKNLF